MHLGVIACQVLTRELCAAAAKSPCTCHFRWLPQGLHDTPDQLRIRIAGLIASLEQESESIPDVRRLDAVVLGFGLCGGAAEGLRAGRLPLVIPRADDCIALLLGGRERYYTELSARDGIYWLSSGWLEYADVPDNAYYQRKLAAYASQYGAENAGWILEQENAWIKRYECCTHILSPVAPFPGQEAQAARIARQRGWPLYRMQGDNRLLEHLLSGEWDEADFLVCPPGRTVSASYDERVIRAADP